MSTYSMASAGADTYSQPSPGDCGPPASLSQAHAHPPPPKQFDSPSQQRPPQVPYDAQAQAALVHSQSGDSGNTPTSPNHDAMAMTDENTGSRGPTGGTGGGSAADTHPGSGETPLRKPVVAQAIPIGVPLAGPSFIASPPPSAMPVGAGMQPMPPHAHTPQSIFMHGMEQVLMAAAADPGSMLHQHIVHGGMDTTGDHHPPPTTGEEFSQLMGIRPPPIGGEAMLINSLGGAVQAAHEAAVVHDPNAAYYDATGRPIAYDPQTGAYSHSVGASEHEHGDQSAAFMVQVGPGAPSTAAATAGAGDTPVAHPQTPQTPHGDVVSVVQGTCPGEATSGSGPGAAPAAPTAASIPPPTAASDNPTDEEMQGLVKQANDVWGDKIDKSILQSLLGLLSAARPQNAIFEILQNPSFDEEQKVSEVAKVIKQHLADIDKQQLADAGASVPPPVQT